MTDRPTFEGFKSKALKNPDVKAAYDEAAPAYAMKREMLLFWVPRSSAICSWVLPAAVRMAIMSCFMA